MEKEEMDFLTERFLLVKERIEAIEEDNVLQGAAAEYFSRMSSFLCMLFEAWDYVGSEEYKSAELNKLRDLNHSLYAPAKEENYGNSFLNPSYAVKRLGKEQGQMLSFLASELFGMIPCIYERNLFDMTIRMELFTEVYSAFVYSYEETGNCPGNEEIRQILYWFVSDYQDVALEKRIGEQLGVNISIADDIVRSCDLNDIRYLYRYGEYVTDSEERLACFLNSLSEEEIAKIADTYTEGYRIGFLVTNKDISRKKTVAVYYQAGFERIIRKAIENFEKIGLRTILFRTQTSVLHGKGLNKTGFFGAYVNRQYEYDHSEDAALFFDKAFVNRKLEVMKTVYEMYKEPASVYGGPAVIDVFGEPPFSPVINKDSIRFDESGQKLQVEYSVAATDLVNQYIKGEERSFTIIAFPIPAIGERFEEIFAETVRINTLDYILYRNLQQTLIDALDLAEYVEVKGMNGNHTDLRVALRELTNPDKETNFENCVADVNIPVGEVFTSPKLSGTDGILHVKKVFLNDLEYRDLEITFKNGKTVEYGCGNFATKEEGQKYVKDNVLFHHESLPVGEFAIGTNTTAYVIAKRFAIEDKLPILIAEKTGPHFALGDTCYSHAEDVKVYNPDGKEIVAKENEVSSLRHTDRSKAYFSCHTDITIPYDELGELSAVCKDGSRIAIIRNGRFVLPGVEELNRPFDD